MHGRAARAAVAVLVVALAACGGSTAVDDVEAADAGAGGTQNHDPVAHSLSLTIENQSSSTAFVDGGFPFGLVKDGAGLALYAWCSCDKCGTGDECLHGDPLPVAVELATGESLTMTASLLSYTVKAVTEQSCPEALDWSQTCDEAQQLEPGSYVVVVPYDDQAAMIDQGLEDSGLTQWDLPLWMGSGFGVASFSQTAQQPFELAGDTSSVTVTIQ